MTEIDNYIDWDAIWKNEVVSHDTDILEGKEADLFNALKGEKNMSLDVDECTIDLDLGTLLFCFSEEGGKSEGDPQGWFRMYWFQVTISEDFLITDAGYEQG